MASHDSFIVEPCRAVSGVIKVPGDKSISHRLALLLALGSGRSVIRNFLCCEDCLNTLSAVERLGAEVKRSPDEIEINGVGGTFKKPSGALDLGNSGTGMRLLSGFLAGHDFVSELTGDASLRSRPMRRIKEPLELMGGRLELGGENGCAPIRIKGSRLHGINYTLPVASAQVKSCILFAGLYAEGETIVNEPVPARDHTEKLLAALELNIQVNGPVISVTGTGGKALSVPAREWCVPGDFSSAAFWMTAGAIAGNGCVLIENVGLNARRTAFIDVLRRMGADVQVVEKCSDWEPTGDITVRGGTLNGTEVKGDEIANLIDELPLVAVAGAMAKGTTSIRNAEELRVKETDRISAMVSNLTAMGVSVEERCDGLAVEGGAEIKGGADVNSFGDHRIAMAFSVLALFANKKTKIVNIGCVDTSYPAFWDDMKKLVRE